MTPGENRAPVARLSLVWLLCLGGLGVIFPYFALYLTEHGGLSGSQVGVVAAILPLVGLAAQPLWGNLADRTGARSRILALLGFGAALGYLLFARVETFAGFVLCAAVLACFSTPLIPSCVSLSFALLRESGAHRFGRVRVWGTVGFALTVGGFPLLLGRMAPVEGAAQGGATPGLGLMFVVAAVLVAAAGLVALGFSRSDPAAARAARGDWRELLHNAAYMRFLLFLLLAYMCLQGPMALFPILVRSQGGGIEAISRMWLLMLLLEVPLVLFLGAGVARIGPRAVIAIGIAAGGVRWLVSGFVDDLGWVTAVQVLHGVTVWGVVLGAPIYADQIVPERLRSTAQGVLAMVGPSLGGILSNLGTGWLIDVLGPTAPYRLSGISALVLTLLIPWLLTSTRSEARARTSTGP